LQLETLEVRLALAANAYITGPGDPWGQTTNDAAMDSALGAGNWDRFSFDDAVANGVFTPGAYEFLFFDGSDHLGDDIENFINANQASLEAWVNDGGSLFMNAARNSSISNPMVFGFGAMLQSDSCGTCTAVDSAHPIFNGPFTPVGTVWTGTSFGHDTVTGVGFTPLILNESGNNVLVEMDFGSGHVILGGMTTTNFHNPQPEATNLRINILVYATSLFPASFTQVAPDPRTEPVPFVDIMFDFPITEATFDTSDLTLTRDGGGNLITPAVTITPLGGDAYRIGNLTGLTTPDGIYALTLDGSGIDDSGGTPLDGSTTERWVTDPRIPPLSAERPLGSLIYDPEITRSLPAPTDIQDLEIDLDGGQKFSVLIQPTGTLQPTVTVSAPGGGVIAMDTAGAAGELILLQDLLASAAGTYHITVAPAGGTTGAFTLQVFLNAAIEEEEFGGPTNDTTGTAQDIDGSFIDLTAGGADRGAVLGSVGRTLYGVSRCSDRLQQFDGVTGAEGAAVSMSVDGNAVNCAYGLTVDPNTGQFYALVEFSGVTRALATIDPDTGVGTSVGDVGTGGEEFIEIAFDNSGTLYGVTGERGANTETLFEIDEANGMLTLLTPLSMGGGGSGESLAFNPDDGLLYRYQAGTFESIDPNNGFASTTIPTSGASPFSPQAMTYVGTSEFLLVDSNDRFSITTAGVITSLGRLDANGTAQGVVIVGTDTADVFSFTLAAGQTTTLAMSGPRANLDLLDGSMVLATGTPAQNVGQVISRVTVTVPGTYFARVSAAFDTDYSLLVTRDADFDTESNRDDSPQDMGPVQTVLGYAPQGTPFMIAAGPPSFFAMTGAGGDLSILYELDPATGQIITTVGPTGFSGITGMDFDPATGEMYGTGGVQGDSPPLMTIDLDSGAGTLIGGSGNFADITFGPTGILYGYGDSHDTPGDDVYEIDPSDGSFTLVGEPGHFHQPGIAFDDAGTLYFKSGNTLYTMDPANAAILTTISILGVSGTLVNVLEADAAGMLYSATRDGSSSTIYQIDPSTGAATALGGPINIRVSALSFAGVTNSGDFYSFDAAVGEPIRFTTTTPGDGPFEFPNNLDPVLELFDPTGALVAGDDNGAPDGRNAFLAHIATMTGTYKVRILGTNQTRGEYVLERLPAVTTDDFDDAPASYGTASHSEIGPRLGATRDADPATFDTPFADGDDAAGLDDEDGVTFPASVVAHPTTTLTSQVVVNATGGRLDAWIDFNQNGVFDGSEQIAASLPLSPGDNTIFFSVPTTAFPGTTIARFRLSTFGGLSPTGPAADGEVEDHTLLITPAPVASARLLDDPQNPGRRLMLVTGTNGNDTINLQLAACPHSLRAQINTMRFPLLTPTSRVVIYGLQGNDTVTVNPCFPLPLFVYGGPGNDRINGGSGPDVLDGGPGDDQIFGSGANDVLISGTGTNRLDGQAGDDLVIGGRTSYDTLDAALVAIHREWTSAAGYLTRIQNLRNGGPATLNGPFVLRAGTTVHDDPGVNELRGGADRDWFFARRTGLMDTLPDLVLAGMLAESVDDL
jgi:hypothetical protein